MTVAIMTRPFSAGARLAGSTALILLLSACQTLPPPAERKEPLLPDVAEAMSAARATGKPLPRAALPDDVARDLAAPTAVTPPQLSRRQTEPRFDLNVANATPQQLLAAIVTDTRYSVLVDPALKGPITLNLKDVTVREALDAMRDLYRFEYRIDGNRILVHPPELQTRLFKVSFPTLTRTGRSDIRVVAGSLTGGGTPPGVPGAPGSVPGAIPGAVPGAVPGAIPGTTPASTTLESSRITTTTRNDIWGEVETAIKLLIGDKLGDKTTSNVVISPQTGTIVVRAMPNEMREVERYLKAARGDIERQVMLEAKIVEVKLTDSFQAGINWAAFRNSGSRVSVGQTGPANTLQTLGNLSNSAYTADPGNSLVGANSVTQGLFGLALQTGSFSALLNFLEGQGTVQVLSSPRIATLNNQKAVLKVGTDDFFVTNVSTTSATSGAGAVTSPSITVQPFFSGIALDVTPVIDGDANIMLHVHPSVSAVSEKSKVINLGSMGSFTLPLASSAINETDSLVRVQNGNIVAIGGLMKQGSSNTRTGVPGAQDVAGIGGLFQSRSREMEKYELVILIKPTVVQSTPGDLADAR